MKSLSQHAAAWLLTLFLPVGLSAEMISGRVVDPEGVAVVELGVVVNGVAFVTDEDGRYLGEVVAASHYQVALSKPGWYPSVHQFAREELDRGGRFIVPDIQLVQRRPGRVMLAVAGDTMMGRRYLEPLPGEPQLIDSADPQPGMRAVLRWMKPYLALADFASVNLETQLWDTSTPPPRLPKSVTFYTHSAVVGALAWAGVDYVALGNNHTFDYRDRGLAWTLESLKRNGMAFSGAGVNAKQARTPYSHVLEGQSFGWLSYVGWPGTFEPNQVAGPTKGGAAFGSTAQILDDVRAAAENKALVVQIHAGLEYQNRPALTEQTLYRRVVEEGADLVLGHHSHVLQGLELHRDKLIAYSLGNFAFDQYIYSTQLSMLLYVWMDGSQFYRAEIVPLYLNGYIPTPATRQLRFDVLQRMAHLSQGSVGSPLSFSASGGHAQVAKAPLAQRAQQAVIVGAPSAGIHHLAELGVAPLARSVEFADSVQAFRLGVDRIKRGTFDHVGEFGTTDRTWLLTERAQVEVAGDRHLRLRGRGLTGLKTFERAFTPSSPITVEAHMATQEAAEVKVWLQRRVQGQTRDEALQIGPRTLLGRVLLPAGAAGRYQFQGAMPRTNTRGVRILVEIEQSPDSELTIDDLTWLEWRTPWLTPERGGVDLRQFDATHVEISSSP